MVGVRRYVQHYGLGEACDDVASVLKRVAVRLGKTRKVKVLTGTGEVTWPLGWVESVPSPPPQTSRYHFLAACGPTSGYSLPFVLVTPPPVS